jgi:hypothetical protein
METENVLAVLELAPQCNASNEVIERTPEPARVEIVQTAYKVQCPICKAVRTVTKPTQASARCPNQECKTASGRHRVFWILKRTHEGKKIIDAPTNRAQ